MEAVMMHGSLDQSISPHKSHLKNSKKFHQNQFFSNSSEAFWASHFSSTGLLQPPPPPPPFLSQSYPPYPLHHTSQPPLLPLPAAALRRSASVANKKVGNNPSRTRDPSLASKKSRSPKKEGKNLSEKSKDARKRENGGGLRSVVAEQLDIFSGSAAFAVSPPPSSLPLPTFPMRPKLSCKAEAAAGVDAGATDDLRRLLRLR